MTFRTSSSRASTALAAGLLSLAGTACEWPFGESDEVCSSDVSTEMDTFEGQPVSELVAPLEGTQNGTLTWSETGAVTPISLTAEGPDVGRREVDCRNHARLLVDMHYRANTGDGILALDASNLRRVEAVWAQLAIYSQPGALTDATVLPPETPALSDFYLEVTYETGRPPADGGSLVLSDVPTPAAKFATFTLDP